MANSNTNLMSINTGRTANTNSASKSSSKYKPVTKSVARNENFNSHLDKANSQVNQNQQQAQEIDEVKKIVSEAENSTATIQTSTQGKNTKSQDAPQQENVENPTENISDNLEEISETSGEEVNPAVFSYLFSANTKTLLMTKTSEVSAENNLMAIMPQSADDKSQSMLDLLGGKTWTSADVEQEFKNLNQAQIENFQPQNLNSKLENFQPQNLNSKLENFQPQNLNPAQLENSVQPQNLNQTQVENSVQPQNLNQAQLENPVQPQNLNQTQVENSVQPQNLNQTQVENSVQPQNLKQTQLKNSVQPQNLNQAQLENSVQPQNLNQAQLENSVQPQNFGSGISQVVNSVQPQNSNQTQPQTQNLADMLGVNVQTEDNTQIAPPTQIQPNMQEFEGDNSRQGSQIFSQNLTQSNNPEFQTSQSVEVEENFATNLNPATNNQTPIQQNSQVQNPEAALNVREDFNVPAQIVEQARLIRNSQNTEMVINLKPEHLGELTLKISVNHSGTLTANFYSDNAQVRAIIDNSLVQLKQELSNAGLKVENVQVFAGLSDGGLANGQGGRAWQQNQQRNSNRRIDFSAFEEEADAIQPVNENEFTDGVDYKV